MPRGPHTRRNLLAATIAVAAREGYAHTTTRAIADEAGVSEATIYRHFPDKLALFAAAVGHQNAEVDQALAALPGRAGKGSVLENVRAALHELASMKEAVLPLELAMLIDPELAQARADRLAAAHELTGAPRYLADYLAAEQGRGRVRAGLDPERAALVLLGSLFTAVVGGGAAIDDCADVLVHGLLAPAEG
ncbi:TetR/AcrR family transcriptional regulator [Cellulomonas fimi]|uniref:TetR/AcrR family transcriptional regulator n=1 Tax=Cellulomonas fimi TaxID=1708 RepID=UPI00234CD602|nr:TetR/AcrR family transcriptional regulator [Cellulomonas fimi]MDC7120391.1 TetR/AcrR family transcriptional regulator [Cellulomonas fimi]